MALVASGPSRLSYMPLPDDWSSQSLIYTKTDDKLPMTVLQLPTSEQLAFQELP